MVMLTRFAIQVPAKNIHLELFGSNVPAEAFGDIFCLKNIFP